MGLIDFSSAPTDPIERLVWLGGIDRALRAEVESEWQRSYFEARLEGRFDAALGLNLHSKKRALAWTRRENESCGRVVARWRDGY